MTVSPTAIGARSGAGVVGSKATWRRMSALVKMVKLVAILVRTGNAVSLPSYHLIARRTSAMFRKHYSWPPSHRTLPALQQAKCSPCGAAAAALGCHPADSTAL